ncbi:MAG: hypothetical protein ACEPOV_08960 [Hyphomicrobiales bacterium]
MKMMAYIKISILFLATLLFIGHDAMPHHYIMERCDTEHVSSSNDQINLCGTCLNGINHSDDTPEDDNQCQSCKVIKNVSIEKYQVFTVNLLASFFSISFIEEDVPKYGLARNDTEANTNFYPRSNGLRAPPIV